jgi:nucleotide-binding universal stress UspA family protein
MTEGADIMLRVLVPSDGSGNSQYGVRHVVSEFMKHKDLDIHILNVQRPFSRHVSRFADRRARTEFHQVQAERALKPALQALDGAGIPYTVHVEVGDKADCIAQAAQWLHCDRIVMGTARKSSLARFFEDSVTNKVIERTTVPVEVIAGDAVSPLKRVGIPAGVGAGALVLWIAAQ